MAKRDSALACLDGNAWMTLSHTHAAKSYKITTSPQQQRDRHELPVVAATAADLLIG